MATGGAKANELSNFGTGQLSQELRFVISLAASSECVRKKLHASGFLESLWSPFFEFLFFGFGHEVKDRNGHARE